MGGILIETLTDDQFAAVHAARDKWWKYGTSTSPADRPAAQAAIATLYRRLGHQAPRYVWHDSPKAGIRAIDSLGDELGMSLRDSMWESPGRIGMAQALWESLKGRVNISLGHELRESLRSILGSLRDSLDDGLEAPLWYSLQEPLDESQLDDPRPNPLWECLFGQHESTWIAYYTTISNLGLVTYADDEVAHLDTWATISKSCGWWWPYTNICVITDRPAIIHTEPIPGHPHAATSLHHQTDMAIVYRDGWGIHFQRGMDPAEISNERRGGT